MVVSANTCLKVTPKISNSFVKKFINVENATSTRYKLAFSLVSSSNKSHHSHLKSIMHSFPRCIFMLHFDLEKTKSCKYVAT